MRVVFMGTPGFAVPSLQHLLVNKYEVAAVYTRPDKTAGRGRSLMLSPVKQAAAEAGLPVLQPGNFKSPETLKQLAGLKPDVIVVSAYGQILPQAVLDIPPKGCVNIHPSLLPRHRGAAPVAGAILAGDEFTGVSIMLLDRGMDTGPVLVQAQIPVSDRDNTGFLTDKLAQIAARLLPEVLPRWEGGEINPRPQDEAAASYTALFSKQEGEIDWSLPALEIWRKVRAFYPWPGCYTLWQGKQLKITQAEVLPPDNTIKMGQVAALDRPDTAFGVGTGKGLLGVVKVQLEGKRVMPAAEFLRGQKDLINTILPC